MTSLPEIEAAIKQLPEDEVRQLLFWLDSYLDDRWDQQIKADLETGKLERLIAQADKDIKLNQVRDLDEVLDNF